MSSRAGKKTSSQKGAQKPRQNGQPQSQPTQKRTENVASSPPKVTAPTSTPATTWKGPETAQGARAQEARRLSGQERQAAARAAAQRRRRAATLRRTAVIAVVALLVGGGLVAWFLQEANKPGESVLMQVSRPHVEPGQAHEAYTTDPPTSGPHVGSLPQWKVYTEPITRELQVHGLEDGGVIINYRSDLDKAIVDRLAGITGLYLERPAPKSHIVMSPFPDLSHPIVLTAWRRIDRLDTFDEARIRRFIDEYIGIDRHVESGS